MAASGVPSPLTTMTTEILYYTKLQTQSPVGILGLATSDRGLVLLSFKKDGHNFPPRRSGGHFRDGAVQWIEAEERTRPYAAQLTEYFAGQRKNFDLPLDLRGTPFQKRCWEALLMIPYGSTASYADIAKAVGNPMGFRAVGMANNRNPVAIMVPCHRVIASGGTLCGYGGGLPAKEWLLKLEGASWKAGQDSSLRPE